MPTHYVCPSCGTALNLKSEYGLRYTVCSVCGGFGQRLSPKATEDEAFMDTCSECNGVGFILESAQWLIIEDDV